MSQVKIIIPARLASSRLACKPLIDIDAIPMVIRVAKCGEAVVGKKNVIVACCGSEIANVCAQYDIQYIVTDPGCASGTDRVAAAISSHEAAEFGVTNDAFIINLQGDVPFILPSTIEAVISKLENGCSIATAACPIKCTDDLYNPSVVKVVLSGDDRAIYFSRALVPYGAPVYYKHIGIYGYTTGALYRFVGYPVTELEEYEKLEQLRILEYGDKIHVAVVNDDVISIDTASDLELLAASRIN